jgi:hypothetical protein
MERRTRLALLAAVVVAVVAGVAIALAVGGDDRDEGRRAGPPTTERPRATVTSPGPHPTGTAEPDTPPARARRREAAEVGLTVAGLVEAVEQGDAARACRILGHRARGTGPQGVQGCARAAGVALDHLPPSSDELSIEDTAVSGRRASVRLAGGSSVVLGRKGGRWVVEAVRAPG